MFKQLKSTVSFLLATLSLLLVTAPAFAYYEVDYAHILKLNIDSTRCDATVCRVIVYFDKNLNLPATACNATVKDRAVLFLYKNGATNDEAVAMDKIYSSAMSAYLSGQQVYMRVTGCDAATNLTKLYYLENK